MKLRDWFNFALSWVALLGLMVSFIVLPIWLALLLDALIVAWLWSR